MASLREIGQPMRRLRVSQVIRCSSGVKSTRWASAAAAAAPAAGEVSDLLDLESRSTVDMPPPTADQIKEFGLPRLHRATRSKELPGSRYQYHPPKFNRGPLHPIQSPPSSDPISRDFAPGPFNMPRLRDTYHAMIEPDLMTMTYSHKIPGNDSSVGNDTADAAESSSSSCASSADSNQRLRGWDGSSPYHKNRPLRKARGPGNVLQLVERPVTFRTVPEIRSISIDAFDVRAIRNKAVLLAAKTALQAISGGIPVPTLVRRSVVQFGIAKGQVPGMKVTIEGDKAYEFLDKCVHLVFPRIREWPGIKATSGDRNGNLSWGLGPDEVALFPEIEVNADMYPGKTIPGCRIFVETTATSDRQARLLLQALGVPFDGNFGS